MKQSVFLRRDTVRVSSSAAPPRRNTVLRRLDGRCAWPCGDGEGARRFDDPINHRAAAARVNSYSMPGQKSAGEADRARARRHVRQLIAALDRRVPHFERAGELAIARDAATLRKKAWIASLNSRRPVESADPFVDRVLKRRFPMVLASDRA
jgi:hypothetical protein